MLFVVVWWFVFNYSGWGVYAQLTVTSSEKVDRVGRYKSFCLNSIPYPGCEFFKEFKDSKYNANNLYFKWDNPSNDATFNISHSQLTNNNSHINNDTFINNYKKWNLIKLTQNYIRLILDYASISIFNSNV